MPASSIRVAPRWHIVGPEKDADAGERAIRLERGAGFGDGAHPTTQLCLQALSALAPRGRAYRLLDFGSGSGILSIAAAAHLGAEVEAVEIDARAVEHAARNFAANGVVGRVRQVRSLGEARGPFDFVVANILRGVLLDFAPDVCGVLARPGILVLSGLVSTDVPEVGARYAAVLGFRPEVYEAGEWRALVWKLRAAAGSAPAAVEGGSRP